ncbi:hypothetical protein JG687_00017915 [Phytophthora cactorum]|uniref:SWEET sugar transporter n=1 Tax=Phytophthora cactorum TaxID=29920 RepID=A0A8T1TLT3_9STRA|nr:hypothetical protein JG687_00017915 [Phytophthora cactorum]
MTDSDSTAHTVFVVLTIISSIFVRVAPFPDCYRVYKFDNIFPLFAVSVFGIFTSAAFIGIFYKWSQERASVRRLCTVNLIIVVVVAIYTIVALTTTVMHQSRLGVNRTIGWISIVTSVGMFGAPLVTIKKVVQTKSAASLSFIVAVVHLSPHEIPRESRNSNQHGQRRDTSLHYESIGKIVLYWIPPSRE